MKIENEEIYDPAIIADSFNTYFTNIGSNLAAKIPHSEKHFTEYLNQSEVVMTEKELTSEEFESAFKTLKTNKANGYDDINSNVVKDVYKELTVTTIPHMQIINQIRCFSEQNENSKSYTFI